LLGGGLLECEDGVSTAAVELQEVKQLGLSDFIIEDVRHLEELRDRQVAGEVGVEEVRHGELDLIGTGQPGGGQRTTPEKL
jgi:hypothetical protein